MRFVLSPSSKSPNHDSVYYLPMSSHNNSQGCKSAHLLLSRRECLIIASVSATRLRQSLMIILSGWFLISPHSMRSRVLSEFDSKITPFESWSLVSLRPYLIPQSPLSKGGYSQFYRKISLSICLGHLSLVRQSSPNYGQPNFHPC